MACAWTTAQIASIARSNVTSPWQIVIHTLHADLHLVRDGQVVRPAGHLAFGLGLLVAGGHLVLCNGLFVGVDVLRPLVDLRAREVISYGVLAGLHVGNLLWVHKVIADEHAARLEGAFVLVGVSSVGRVHGRRVIGQVDALGRGR